MRHKAAWATCAAIAAIGCGSSDNSGDNNTTPPAPSGTIVSIAVNSSAPTMFLEASETFTAVATYTGGATQTVTGGAWATDASAVAQVDASTGRVVALSNGEATISFDYQGVRGSKHVRVLPNYGGSWDGIGKYTIASCTQTEGFADTNVCGNFGVGQAFRLWAAVHPGRRGRQWLHGARRPRIFEHVLQREPRTEV